MFEKKSRSLKYYSNFFVHKHIYIYIIIYISKEKAYKINAKIEDVGLIEYLKSTKTRNGH